MTKPIEVEALVVLRELPSGTTLAYALGDPKLVARGDDRASAVGALRSALEQHLTRIPAERLSAFDLPAESTLRRVRVPIGRPDLPRRSDVTVPLSLPCVVVPTPGGNWWVRVLGLDHTAFVPKTEDLDTATAAEIRRITGARELTPPEYLELVRLADPHELVPIPLELDRAGSAQAHRHERKEALKARRTKAAGQLLEEIGRPLTGERARHKAPPIVGRDREIRSLAGLLDGQTRLCVMLVGDELVGKSAVLDGLLCQDLVRFTRPVYATSGAALVAGQSGFGQLQERVDDVMRAAEALDAVLYFDNFADLFAGGSGSIQDIASAMRPYLERGRVRVVGEITPQLLEHHERRHTGFFAQLHRITIEPLDRDVTITILRERVAFARRRQSNRPTLADDALVPLVDLADRYLSYEVFPGKAVRLYEELRATHEAAYTDSAQTAEIGRQLVYETFSIRSGIPTFLLRQDRAMKLQELVRHFERRIVGQAGAIARIAETLCVVKAQLQPPTKPLANFLFIGPTGVGKTEVAKALADLLFGSRERLVRFDMSEFTDSLAAGRLIRGTERDDGLLTRAVRQQPFCVILLDEIEKAHHAVFDLLLQVCGEGRLSDARGRTAYFHNAIIIMTSNLGAAHRRPATGFGGDATTDDRYFADRVHEHFRPEFVNRLDRVIPFHPLSREEIDRVATVYLDRLRTRSGLLDRGASLEVDPFVMSDLAADGFSDAYGARALRRCLEDRLAVVLATTMATLGGRGQGVALQVTRPGPDNPAATGRDIAMATDDLHLHAAVRSTRQGLRNTGQLAKVAALRRSAAAGLALDPLEELRERTAALVSELNYGADRRRRRNRSASAGAKLGLLTAEHAELSELLGALGEQLAAIETAEELANAAVYEGEPIDLYVDAARDAHRGFARHLVRGILRADPRPEIVLHAQEQDDRRALDRWLPGLLDQLGPRRWTARFHIDGDKHPTWPAKRRFGPEVDAETMRKRLAASRRTWKNVLLRVRGPLAGSMLHFELGLQVWRSAVAGDGDARLHLRRVPVPFDLTDAIWEEEEEALEIPVPLTSAYLKAMAATREFLADGQLVAAGCSEPLPLTTAQYWDHIESVLFEPLVFAVHAGRDPMEA